MPDPYEGRLRLRDIARPDRPDIAFDERLPADVPPDERLDRLLARAARYRAACWEAHVIWRRALGKLLLFVLGFALLCVVLNAIGRR